MQRMTRQRIAVLEELGVDAGFRSAQQVHEDLVKAGHRVGLATVYRNLQALAEAERVDTLRGPEGEVLYRRCADEGHHHHLVCRRCKKVEEIAPVQVESWVAGLGKATGYSDLQHSIEVWGICPECSAA